MQTDALDFLKSRSFLDVFCALITQPGDHLTAHYTDSWPHSVTSLSCNNWIRVAANFLINIYCDLGDIICQQSYIFLWKRQHLWPTSGLSSRDNYFCSGNQVTKKANNKPILARTVMSGVRVASSSYRIRMCTSCIAEAIVLAEHTWWHLNSINMHGDGDVAFANNANNRPTSNTLSK